MHYVQTAILSQKLISDVDWDLRLLKSTTGCLLVKNWWHGKVGNKISQPDQVLKQEIKKGLIIQE